MEAHSYLVAIEFTIVPLQTVRVLFGSRFPGGDGFCAKRFLCQTVSELIGLGVKRCLGLKRGNS